MSDYTIPRTTRELQQQHDRGARLLKLYHTKNYQGTTTLDAYCFRIRIIIPYQELPGNYNRCDTAVNNGMIIPYQELPENYNMDRSAPLPAAIIPYQELPGNYNMPFPLRKRSGIIPCKDLTVRTPALLLGNFCVAFFVRSGYNSIRRLSIALSAFSGRGNVGM